MAKIPYSPAQGSHTWAAFGDGSRPMLALDQQPGIAWETPHRHAPKNVPRKDCANNLVVRPVLVLLSFLGQTDNGRITHARAANEGSTISVTPDSLIHLPRSGPPSPALTRGPPDFSLSRPPPLFPLTQESLTSFSP